MQSFPWLFAVFGGAIILGVVMVYGLMKSRQASRGQREAAERATRDLYHKDQHKTRSTTGRGE